MNEGGLKPCPFCGGTDIAKLGAPMSGWLARCEDCGGCIEGKSWNHRAIATQEPVSSITIGSGIPELRASLVARAIRQSLRAYLPKMAETTLPECMAVEVERALVAHEKIWGTPEDARADNDANP